MRLRRRPPTQLRTGQLRIEMAADLRPECERGERSSRQTRFRGPGSIRDKTVSDRQYAAPSTLQFVPESPGMGSVFPTLTCRGNYASRSLRMSGQSFGGSRHLRCTPTHRHLVWRISMRQAGLCLSFQYVIVTEHGNFTVPTIQVRIENIDAAIYGTQVGLS